MAAASKASFAPVATMPASVAAASASRRESPPAGPPTARSAPRAVIRGRVAGRAGLQRHLAARPPSGLGALVGRAIGLREGLAQPAAERAGSFAARARAGPEGLAHAALRPARAAGGQEGEDEEQDAHGDDGCDEHAVGVPSLLAYDREHSERGAACRRSRPCRGPSTTATSDCSWPTST